MFFVCGDLLFIDMVGLVFWCFWPGIKKRYVLYTEGKKRKRTKIGWTVEEFDKYIAEF